MSTRTAVLLARSVWTLSSLFAATALAIIVLGVSVGGSFLEFGAAFNTAAIAATFSTVGAVVASHRSRNAIGWIMCAAGLLFAPNALAGSYAAYALYNGSEPMPGAAFAAWANVWTGSIPLLPLLLLLPDGKLPSHRWRPVVWLVVGTTLAEVAFWAFAPGRFLGWPPASNPLGIDALEPLLDPYVGYAQTPLLVLAYPRNCKVRLSLKEEPEALNLEVSDDGRGMGEDHRSGVGLSSMRERAEELGGSCVVLSAPSGGTRVKAQLPCVKGAADETGLRKGV